MELPRCSIFASHNAKKRHTCNHYGVIITFIDFPRTTLLFFLIGIVGGGVQLGPLGTAATNRPIVPTPGDYDDGEIGGMIG
jgi:hypothetical protein